jgi:cell division protein FtsL
MRNKRSFDWICLKCGILIFGGILAYLAYQVHVVNMGYEISQMEKEKKELERLHTELQIEISSLSSLDRIEHIAVNQLGMVPGSSTGKIMVTELNPASKTLSVEVAERETTRNIFK